MTTIVKHGNAYSGEVCPECGGAVRLTDVVNADKVFIGPFGSEKVTLYACPYCECEWYVRKYCQRSQCDGKPDVAHCDNCSELLKLRSEVESLQEALTPSDRTKEAYICRFSVKLPCVDSAGNEFHSYVNVPWVVIKKVMAEIRKYADAMSDKNSVK